MSAETPFLGNHGNLYFLRPNGFKGTGLNDVTWSTYTLASDSSHFEVVIDGIGTGIGGVDEFKWRENGGAWTEHVDIVPATYQNLAGANGTQKIGFVNGTGHTLADQWVIGNLYAEACTESTVYAQITDTGKRLINPNVSIVFTDSGGELVKEINYANGRAEFFAAPTTVTVEADNGYVLESGLQQIGYFEGFSFVENVDMIAQEGQGDSAKSNLPGYLSISGTINKLFVGSRSMLDLLEAQADGTQKYFLIQIFPYDTDQDASTDCFVAWVTFNSLGIAANSGDTVKSNLSFQGQHGIDFRIAT